MSTLPPSVATATRLTTEHSPRSTPVTHAVLHHAATTSLAAIESLMEPGGRQVSAHYAVKDGARVLKVPLNRRAWSLGSALWDSRAVTVECANDSLDGYTVSAASHESLALIVAHAAQTFDFYPQRDGDPRGWTVLGHREVYTIHGASYATACPGAMDLDRITKRAQALLAAPAAPPMEDDDMPRLIRRTGSATPEWSLFDPSFAGETPLERGYIITTDPAVATDWARLYGTGIGNEKAEPRDNYVALQAAARGMHAAYLRGLPKPGEIVVNPAPVDLSPVLTAIAAVPTAAENGAAARAAIVKP